jgi:hypothetical protein
MIHHHHSAPPMTEFRLLPPRITFTSLLFSVLLIFAGSTSGQQSCTSGCNLVTPNVCPSGTVITDTTNSLRFSNCPTAAQCCGLSFFTSSPLTSDLHCVFVTAESLNVMILRHVSHHNSITLHAPLIDPSYFIDHLAPVSNCTVSTGRCCTWYQSKCSGGSCDSSLGLSVNRASNTGNAVCVASSAGCPATYLLTRTLTSCNFCVGEGGFFSRKVTYLVCFLDF